jgi:charged multivesicular body protein 7
MQNTKRRKLVHNEEPEAAATDYLSFSTGEELGRALELRPYGRPTGLAEVIKDAVEKKELVPLDEYLSRQESIYSRRWIPTPWEVVGWGLRSLGLGVLYGQSNFTVGKFVVIENVELAAQEVLEAQRSLARSSTAGIYSLKTFTSTFEHVLGEGSVLSPTDIQVLLRYMSRDKPSLAYDVQSETIKFVPSETSKPVPIEANDISIAQVKTLQLTLTQAIPPLEARYAELDARVRDAVVKRQSSAAKSFLKARKLVEHTLEQRRENLLQVEESLHAIETAATNVEIVSAMKESTKVMRDLNARVGGVEGVERVTDAMREEMDTAEEISRAVAEPGEAVDEGEVDEEFEALLAQEKAKEDLENQRLGEERRKKEDEERLQRLEEEETREKLRRLEEWEKFQREAREAEEKKVAGESDKKSETERKFEESMQQESSKERDAEESLKEKIAEEAVENTREGVKAMGLDDERDKQDRALQQGERQKKPVLAS